MKRNTYLLAVMIGMLAVFSTPVSAGIESYRGDQNYSQYIRYDRYLDVEIWTNDDEYYSGENLRINFRANKDCYVVIYNIDTHGRVNLLYPADRWDDLKIEGGKIYQIPDGYDDYELTVRGPEGVEYLQIVASRKFIPIPDWHDGSDLICNDDPLDYADYINASYFGCDDGCLLAFDMTIFNVKQWHRDYFRPVHVYQHYNWNTCGSVYIDYPWGGTVYIDGIYWGCAPLFIPRIYYGWHYITIYDSYGYCWEDNINIYKRKSVIIDNTIIKTRSGVKSKYRDVHRKGYLNPEKNGYPEYVKEVRVKKEARKAIRAAKSDHSWRKGHVDSKSRTVTKYNLSGQSQTKTKKSAYDKHRKTPKSESSSDAANWKSSAKKSKSTEKTAGKLHNSKKTTKKKDSSNPKLFKKTSSKSSGSNSKTQKKSMSNSTRSGSVKSSNSKSSGSGGSSKRKR